MNGGRPFPTLVLRRLTAACVFALGAFAAVGVGARPAPAATPLPSKPVACEAMAGSLKLDGVTLLDSVPAAAGRFTPERGSRDGFYDAAACGFDPGKLLCPRAENVSCLTSA